MNIHNTFAKTFLTDDEGDVIEHTIQFISVYHLLAYGLDEERDFETEMYHQTHEGNYIKLP